MVAAAPIPVITDSRHVFNDQHPTGSWAHGEVLKYPVQILTGRMHDDGAVKLHGRHLGLCLAAGLRPTHVLLTRRAPEQSAASWAAAFPPPAHKVVTAAELADEWARARDRLAAARIPNLIIDADDLIAAPVTVAYAIAEFLGRDLDTAAMAAVIDPAFRHFTAQPNEGI